MLRQFLKVSVCEVLQNQSILEQLDQWNSSRKAVEAMLCCCGFYRLRVVEELSRHVDSIASCLRSAHCDSVIVLQLLSLLQLPSNVDISCLTRLSHHVIFRFFTTMRQRGKLLFLYFSLNSCD